ncbi:MAG: DUF3301 domain-containing protein [Halofilum sp. (in: g-proteobacteria)]
MSQLFVIFIVASIGAWWWSSMQAREAATRAARQACGTFDTQLLDDTVALRSVRPRRNGSGRMTLRRVYRFEFTRSGGERYHGYATLLGRRVIDVHLDAVEGDEIAARRTLQ